MSDDDVVQAFFDRLAEGDIEGWLELLTPDVVAQTPFAPPSHLPRYEGIGAVKSRFGDARLRMQALEFHDIELLHTAEGPIVATCRSEGTMGDGQMYKNRYCWLITITAGRISSWVEYFDPQEVLRVSRS